jgi:hypothetical protein
VTVTEHQKAKASEVIAFVVLVLLVSPASAQSRGDATALIGLWQRANTVCRGSNDRQKIAEACGQRESIAKRLASFGWCYGRTGEYGYQLRWHRCTSYSLR